MKTCSACQQTFEVTDGDREFLKKISDLIPEPTFCPDCRQKRRLAWRNERKLCHRTCDLCSKNILSVYKVGSPFPVYCIDCWWSDKWNPKDFAKDFDFTRPFFEQFKELQDVVPRMAVEQSQNENSEYTNHTSHLKDCYLLFSADFNRDCYYGVWIENSQDSLDNLMINNCQFTHEAIFSNNIYNSTFVIHSSQCSDSAFLLDCNNCSNCFMCYGLRNKSYCIANQQYSKEEYLAEMAKRPLSSHVNYQQQKAHFFEIIKAAPYLFMWRNGTIEDSTGDFLTDVKNCKECFEVMGGRDCKYVQGGYKITDAMDCSYVHGELGYENCECFFMPVRSAFNMNTYNGNDIQYSDMCMNNNTNLFGCVSLRSSKYCILNKEYSEAEYETLLARVIEHMKQGGEYGEFPPVKFSPFAYNETNAQDFFPLTKEEALASGLKWDDEDAKQYRPQTYEIPDDVKDVPESIVNEILACECCSKNYKIIPHEYELLQKIGVPIPRKCFECRHQDRSVFRKKRHLHKRACQKCQDEILTTYPPESTDKVLCEKCYLGEVY